MPQGMEHSMEKESKMRYYGKGSNLDQFDTGSRIDSKANRNGIVVLMDMDEKMAITGNPRIDDYVYAESFRPMVEPVKRHYEEINRMEGWHMVLTPMKNLYVVARTYHRNRKRLNHERLWRIEGEHFYVHPFAEEDIVKKMNIMAKLMPEIHFPHVERPPALADFLGDQLEIVVDHDKRLDRVKKAVDEKFETVFMPAYEPFLARIRYEQWLMERMTNAPLPSEEREKMLEELLHSEEKTVEEIDAMLVYRMV
jgi:hypothetical protein